VTSLTVRGYFSEAISLNLDGQILSTTKGEMSQIPKYEAFFSGRHSLEQSKDKDGRYVILVPYPNMFKYVLQYLRLRNQNTFNEQFFSVIL